MEKAGESTVDGAAAAPEEDDNGDDKMTEVDVEEKTSAGEHSEPKEKLAVPDAEMKEANEPAVPDAEMKEVNKPADKSNDDDTAEPKRKRKDSRGRPRSISTPTTHHMTRRSKSRSESLSEGDRTSSAGERSETKGKHSPAEPTPNQEKRVELDESEGSSPQLEKTPNESDLEDKVCLNTFGVLLVSNLC